MTIALSILASYVLWTVAHELSHALAARALVGARIVSIRVWPGRSSTGRWNLAQVTWEADAVTDGQRAAISMAPRVLELLAAVLSPLASTLPAAIALAGGPVGLLTQGVRSGDVTTAATLLDLPELALRGLMVAYGACGLVILALGVL